MALRLAFKSMVETIVKRRGLTTIEGQQIFDIINQEDQRQVEVAAKAARPTVAAPVSAPVNEQPKTTA